MEGEGKGGLMDGERGWKEQREVQEEEGVGG